MRIAIATQRREALAAFGQGLVARGVEVEWLPGIREAIALARGAAWGMLIQDDPCGTFREDLSDLMEANPFLHTAVMTDLAPEAFHEASEGLGVLCALPTGPGPEDAEALIGKLKGVGAL